MNVRPSCSLLVGLLLLLLSGARAQAASTVVSLTFDDTVDNQYAVRELLDAHGMRATFYVNSGRIGEPKFMSLDQLLTLQRACWVQEQQANRDVEIDALTESLDDVRAWILDGTSLELARTLQSPSNATERWASAHCAPRPTRTTGPRDTSM